MEPIFLVYALK